MGPKYAGSRLPGFVGHRLEEGRFNAGGAAQPPQHARQSQYQLALHGGFSVVIGNHRRFEGLVVLCILECRNDGLGGKAVAHGIAARAFFAFRRCRPGAFERVATVIRRIEGQEGPMSGYIATIDFRSNPAFEQAGIRFLDSDSDGGIGGAVRTIQTVTRSTQITQYQRSICAIALSPSGHTGVVLAWPYLYSARA